VSDAVRSAVRGGVATLTLDRPHNRNALSVELLDALGDALGRVASDDTVRVVVLTHTGPSFCAGADLKAEPGTRARYELADILAAMRDLPKPIVGRIAGHCHGGGIGLVAACDLSVATHEARFAFSEVRIGVAPAIISVVCLERLSQRDALELFLTGTPFSAERAAGVGLLMRAVPAGDLDTELDALVQELLRGSPKALAAVKELVRVIPTMERDEAFRWTTALSTALFASQDAQEGREAFAQRRDPAWVPTQD
jgi:methylglutaconyl-CoA hydratase